MEPKTVKSVEQEFRDVANERGETVDFVHAYQSKRENIRGEIFGFAVTVRSFYADSGTDSALVTQYEYRNGVWSRVSHSSLSLATLKVATRVINADKRCRARALKEQAQAQINADDTQTTYANENPFDES